MPDVADPAIPASKIRFRRVIVNEALRPNDPSSATAATRRADCNRDGPPPLAAALAWTAQSLTCRNSIVAKSTGLKSRNVERFVMTRAS